MQIIAYNQLDEATQVADIESDVITIGRDEENDLTLPSRFISRQHARLIVENGNYFIENLGLNPAVVDGKPVEVGRRVPIKPGQELHLGEFVLYLAEEKEAPAAVRKRHDPLAGAMKLEREVHGELLKRLNLRSVDANAAKDPAYVARIGKHLNNILKSFIDQVDDFTGWFLVADFFRRAIIVEIWRHGVKRGNVPTIATEYAEALDQKYETSIKRLLPRLAQNLKLRLRAEHVKANLDAVDAHFDDAFVEISPRITEGLWEYVVKRYLMKDILDIVIGLGPLEDLLRLPNVTEIMVVGRGKIYVEQDGLIRDTGRQFFSDEVVLTIVERIVTPIGRRIDRSSPIVDARLPDGSRVNATIAPLSLVGPVLTIRKFAEEPFTIDDLIDLGTLTRWSANFLRACVVGRKNILVAGGTGSGKTTLLNVLSTFIPANERIITIEDSAELQLSQEHVVSMETRQANVEGRGAYTIRNLVRNALRMRPDRIIVGEVRGGEALDMLQAMNTGHDGSLTTLHSNNPHDAMKRLEGLVLEAVDMPVRAIREQVVTAMDLVVHLTRFADGARKVTHISEVVGMDDDEGSIVIEDIFTSSQVHSDSRKHGELTHTGYVPGFARELMTRGLLSLDAFV